MEIELDSVISLDYFNNRIAFWEPFLEPWQLKTNVIFSKELSVELFSKDLLNINVTLPLMDNVSLFLMTYSQEFGYPFSMIAKPPMQADDLAKKSSPNEVQKKSLIGRIRKLQNQNKTTYAPFYVRNQTGSKIRYRLETHDGKPVEGVLYEQMDGRRFVNVDNYGIFFDLYPGDSMPIKFSQDIQIHLDTFSQLVLNVELLGIEKSIAAPLDKIKTYEYPVTLDTTSSTTLLVTVEIKNGTKFITIRFPVVFKNLTKFPIDIATVATGYGMQQPPNLSAIIREGEMKAPVPVNRMKNALLKLKPAGPDYRWSTETLNISELNSVELFTSQSLVDDKYTMIKCYVKEKNGCSIIKLCPMVKIKNLLPYPIVYRLSSRFNNQPYSIEKALDPETKEEVYELPIIDKFRVQARMHGIWTEEKPISNTDNIQIIDILAYQLGSQHLHFNIEYDSEGGMRKLVFYNQYWIFNKSGLNLYCKKPYKSRDHNEGTVSLNHVAAESKTQPIIVNPYEWYEHHRQKVDPIMFSYKKTKDIENSIRIRVGDSDWSDKISITAIGDRGMVNVRSKRGRPLCGKSETGYIYSLGVSIDVTPNLKTKIIVFAPRYIFYNQYPFDLVYKQVNTDYEIKVRRNEKVPCYFFVDNKEPPNLLVRMDYPGAQWSSAFSILNVQDYAFKMYSENDEKAREFHFEPFIRIQNCLEAATIFIITVEMKEPPYKISNMTRFPLVVNQRRCGAPIHIYPREIISFTWDEPLQEHVLEVNVLSEQHTHKTSIKVDKIKEFKPLEFNHHNTHTIIKVNVEPEESTRVLKLTDSTYKENRVEEEETSRQYFKMNFAGVGISLINANPTEILYVAVNDIVMEYYFSNFIQSLEMKIQSMQVDNQLSKVTPFSHPVLMFSEKIGEQDSFLVFKLVKSNKFKNIDYFHNVSLEMQEINVKLEERYLYVLLEFFNSLDFSFWTGRKKTKMALQHVDVLKPIYSGDIGDGFIDEMLQRAIPSLHGKKMYFENLSIEPISMYLTFDLSKQSGAFQSLEAPMVRAFRRIGFVLVSFQQAHIFLNSFKLTHAFGTNDELLNPLFRHYLSEGLSEVYKILGTFNFLGNPIGLFKNFGVGFKDFFVSTGKGIVGSDFRSGVSSGSKSLAKHTVYGLFDSGTKFSSSAAKALSTLSMDQQYILERQYISAEAPGNAIQGFSLGGRIFVISLQRGFTGIFRLPYYGGKEGGFVGGLQGVGKGIVGIVLKPLAGSFDFVSKSCEGVKNSTHLNMERKRIRYPRPLFSDTPLKVYDEAEAYGQFLFITNLISSGRLKRLSPDQINMPLLEMVSKDERYVSHLIYKNRKTLLFTNKRIVYLKDTDGFRKKFDVKYTSILDVIEEPSDIRVKVSQAHKIRVLNPRKRKSYYIKCQGEAKVYIYNKIVEYLKTYTPFSTDDEIVAADAQHVDQRQYDTVYSDAPLRSYRQLNRPIPPPPPLPPTAPLGSEKIEFRTVKPGEQMIQPIIVQGVGDGKVDATLEYLLDQPHRHNIAQPIWISRGPPPHDQLHNFSHRQYLDIPPVLYQREGPAPPPNVQSYVPLPAAAAGTSQYQQYANTQYQYPNPNTVNIITSHPTIHPLPSAPLLHDSTSGYHPPPQPPIPPAAYTPPAPPLPPATYNPPAPPSPNSNLSRTTTVNLVTTPGTTRLTQSQYKSPNLRKTIVNANRAYDPASQFRTPLHSLYSSEGQKLRSSGSVAPPTTTTTTTTVNRTAVEPGYESDYLKQAKKNQMERQLQIERYNQQHQVEQSVDNMMKIQQMQIQQMHQLQKNQMELQNLIFQHLIQDKPIASAPTIVMPTIEPKEEITTTTTTITTDSQTQGSASK
ncbi:vacuolar protein sorting-associated protein 13 family protein [Heterostelium album PN500]|uniref:Vacuolar protein sorting-associated protein 13 family protein n=1 Tax=Heterostelium pallidum (strain ATCC 26659 / Pp 5 / PN500) TaxID=670386 RepID=D3B7E0_HETP5|nr:vacuolar protein sorting-associated protein 13 family protein [Heterostelium album PN500]EFA82683.1 vacuolar protein sorting-associated protein 13 family protein [Heterostelium album PN500]|eukprot:XP_020434800.1 vacuolar protein sorting-associated protein 13 family protein [Heterostelium album PN500]